MFNVFSNYLEPLVKANIIELTEQSKPSEVFNQLRIAYNQGVTGIEECIRLFVPNAEDEDDIVDYIMSNEALHPIIKRTNTRVLLNIGVLSPTTLYVNVRIINSMMEVLLRKGKLKKDVFILLSSNLMKNVQKLESEIAVEDLPF